jgi:PPOX class probable F420-dependent enzyme
MMELSVPDILNDVPESHRDLLQAPLTATLTTIDAKGLPQSTAVWYLVDSDGQLKGSITSDRQKYRNLRGNPQCDLFIIDPQNPFRTLEVRAEAELIADPEKATVAKFAKRYSVDEAMLTSAEENRYTVTYRPRRIVSSPPAQG